MRELSGEYGTHPLDKNDTQAQAPEFSGRACAHCGDEIQKGAEAYVYDGVVDNAIYLCSVGCLAIFCTKYETDIDEFHKDITD